MSSSGAVQVKLELGHRAQVRKKPTVEGFTHDWMVFVRGPDHSNIQHFVEKVVFHLHESFPKPKRVCKDPPYKVEESGYAGFILPIEVYFKNKEEPKKVRFDYDLFLHLEGHPPVNHLRCEKLTFNNPTDEFRRKLLKAGGTRDPHKQVSEESKVMVMQEGSTSLFSQHLKLPTLPNNSLTSSSDPKKTKSFHSSKDGSKGGGAAPLTTATTTSTNSSSFSKLHKPSKDHKEKPSKDLKEPKSAFRDSGWEPSKVPKESSRKPKENQPLRDSNPKIGFKEPKAFSKEHRNEGLTHASGLKKRLSTLDSDDLMTKRCKKGFLDPSGRKMPSSDTQHLNKKLLTDRLPMGTSKLRPENEEAEHRKAPKHPPFQGLVDRNDSEMEDQSKSDSEQPSPASSSSSSGFAPTHHKRQVLGPLQSVMQDLQSDNDEEEDSEDNDNDADSDAERLAHTHLTHHQCRVSWSDGSENDGSSPSPTSKEAPTVFKTTNNKILEVKSPIKLNKQDKNANMDCDKAYLDELVELHKRLMMLREGHILQQIVNLIEETGHFHITNTTFDFDLCSLDRSTVRKLQSYLETSGLS
ncbi:protein AF-9 isoform X1 [Nothobranchius furzeri]|uniref:Myeloid/lymphoid or mixed-lineage leukemia n=2 Tax=Nothobranchius furzeri TaxID=105023 RepID=A0A9D2XS68_NOTFU|nr:protein AF-9 isoform X1 [Nothobranchius furzeri]KAF7207335.1 myeloid/lymphoid or mixed-lineage leukemia [Nothobranchius furzeri]